MTSTFDTAHLYALSRKKKDEEQHKIDTHPVSEEDLSIPDHLLFLVPPKPSFCYSKKCKSEWFNKTREAKEKFDKEFYVDETKEIIKEDKVRDKITELLQQIVPQHDKKYVSLVGAELNKQMFEDAKDTVKKQLDHTRERRKISSSKHTSYTNEIDNYLQVPSLYAVDRLMHILKENTRRQRKTFRYIFWGGKTRKAGINARASMRPTRSKFRRSGATQRSRR
jgi:hypothetical protein